jgi:hypothetical protein
MIRGYESFAIRNRGCNGKRCEDLDEIGQLLWYTFFHEIGHCVDDALRREFNRGSLLDENGFFTLSRCDLYYGTILRSEFAACIHSARFLPSAAHDYLERDIREDGRALPLELSRYRVEAYGNAEGLRTAAQLARGFAGVYLFNSQSSLAHALAPKVWEIPKKSKSHLIP